MASEQVKPRDVEAILKRRELLQTALLGSVAFAGLAPILALARGPTPTKAGDKFCTEIEWVINDLKKEVKGLNVRVLAK
jgi:hypothetical protein